MRRYWRNCGRELRAICAAFIFTAGWAAVPVEHLLPEPVTCGMACCLESGVCYCSSRSHARSKEETHRHSEDKASTADPDDSLATEITAVSSSCPAQCAEVPTGFQKKTSLVKERISECAFFTNIRQLIYARAPHFARDALLDSLSSPRAPPSLSL